jgi:hypothetical protein
VMLNRRIDPHEFRSRPLRVHDFLHDVPLHEVWAIRLRGGGLDRTIQDLRALLTFAGLRTTNPVVKGLFRLREWLGALCAWDHERPTWREESYLQRLTAKDRVQSLLPPGTPERPFRVLYVFENEQLSELRNATVHAFSLLSMSQERDGYRAYWAIYVKPASRFTPLYMAMIEPFRRFLVYPAIIRRIEQAWVERYGTESRV